MNLMKHSEEAIAFLLRWELVVIRGGTVAFLPIRTGAHVSQPKSKKVSKKATFPQICYLEAIIMPQVHDLCRYQSCVPFP